MIDNVRTKIWFKHEQQNLKLQLTFDRDTNFNENQLLKLSRYSGFENLLHEPNDKRTNRKYLENI